MTYWTMAEADGSDPLTLCDDCALEGTNMAHREEPFTGGGDFSSMVEAAALIGALAALGGVPSPITCSEEGTCAECDPQ